MDDLWGTPRFKELKALLTLSPQQKSMAWHNMTRYLEFGRLPDRNYNEYLQVPGTPDSNRHKRRPQLEKRRPLPPATQVLQGGPNIPKDPRPELEATKGRELAASALAPGARKR
jgi:hypothetical protein